MNDPVDSVLVFACVGDQSIAIGTAMQCLLCGMAADASERHCICIDVVWSSLAVFRSGNSRCLPICWLVALYLRRKRTDKHARVGHDILRGGIGIA
jgi:hypothetical protein